MNFNIGDRIEVLGCTRCESFDDGTCSIVGKKATVHKHKFDYDKYNDLVLVATDDNHICFVDKKYIRKIGIGFEF